MVLPITSTSCFSHYIIYKTKNSAGLLKPGHFALPLGSGIYNFLPLLRLFFIALLLPAAPAFATEPTLYTIQPGDTLWDISKKWLNSPADWIKLQQLNKIKNPNKLIPYSKIRIPVALMQPIKSQLVVQSSQGDVSIIANNDSNTVKNNMMIFEGDKIITGANASIKLKFENGSTSALQENSQLSVKKIYLPDNDKTNTEIQLHLLQGSVNNNVKKATPNSRFIITTPSAVASVRGTSFRVSNDPLTQQFRTEVLKGKVSVSSQGHSVLLKQGFGVAFKKGQIPSTPTKLLAAPHLSQLQAVLRKMPVFFRFPAIEKAISYRVILTKDNAINEQILARDITKPSVRLTDLASGSYIMSVFAYDNKGLGGQVAYHYFKVKLAKTTPSPQYPTLIFPKDKTTLKENTFSFSWTPSESVDSYRFQLASEPTFQQLYIDIYPYQATSLAISDRLHSGKYYWHVAALDQNNKTLSFTQSRTFRISPPVPRLSNATYKGGSIALKWEIGVIPTAADNIKPRYQYRLQISNKNDFSHYLLNTIVSDRTYQFSWQETGSYFIRVATLDTDGYLGEMSPALQINIVKKGFFGREIINVGTTAK